MDLNADSDARFRDEVERWRIAAGDSYKYAIKAETEGDFERATRLRERAVWQTRNAELRERIVGRDIREMSRVQLTSIDVEDALKLLDRFDANPVEEVLGGAESSEYAEMHITFIREQACAWAFGNAVRNGALNEITRMVAVMEREGLTANLAAMARMTGISRQTLHARLRTE
ncbi:hypothetical protein [Streptomyces sp. 061-3]|uniref:hypothetical protein n=1 Tax=Streptomyces sp. 061-3 TaxID=2789268 RepID=UPI00397EC30B